MGSHESVNDIRDDDISDEEAGELTVDESLEISLDRRDESLLAFGNEVIVLVGVHPLEGGNLDGEQTGDVALDVAGGASAQEPRQNGVAIGASLELDTAKTGIPEVMTEPLVEIVRNLDVDVVKRHGKQICIISQK